MHENFSFIVTYSIDGHRDRAAVLCDSVEQAEMRVLQHWAFAGIHGKRIAIISTEMVRAL